MKTKPVRAGAFRLYNLTPQESAPFFAPGQRRRRATVEPSAAFSCINRFAGRLNRRWRIIAMSSTETGIRWLVPLTACFAALCVNAQSFRVQCPTTTITHPTAANAEPAYTGPTFNGSLATGTVNGAIKCQQISGGDGYATMGDGTQTFMFSFGPLSGLADIANGLPGTESPTTFMSGAPYRLSPGDPATTDGITANTWTAGFPLSTAGFTYNGAVGLTPDIPNLVSIYDISEAGNTVTVVGNAPLGVAVGNQVTISGQDTTGYNGTWTVTGINVA